MLTLKSTPVRLIKLGFIKICFVFLIILHYFCVLIQASATDEAIALLLFEWAVSKYRVGKFRALAVAKILQRKQTEILDEVRHTLQCHYECISLGKTKTAF